MMNDTLFGVGIQVLSWLLTKWFAVIMVAD